MYIVILRGLIERRISFGIELPETSDAVCKKKNKKREGTRNRRSNPDADSACAVLPTGSAERRKEPSGVRTCYFLNHVSAMGWTYKYCTVLNKTLREAARRSAPPVSPHVEGKMAVNATTSLRNKLCWLSTDKVYISKHTRQSQWYTKQSSTDAYGMTSSFFIIVLSTTQEHWKHLESPPNASICKRFLRDKRLDDTRGLKRILIGPVVKTQWRK